MNALKYVTILSIAYLSCLKSATPTTFRGCETDTGLPIFQPNAVDVENCEKEPCYVRIGKLTPLNFTFTSPGAYERLKPQAIASAMGSEVNYPAGDDACESITNTLCPIAEGQLVKYSFDFVFYELWPPVGVNIRFSLLDQNANDTEIVCYQIELVP